MMQCTATANKESLFAQVHHPDLVAQAAGHIDRDNYVFNRGLDPDDIGEFRDMTNLLWAWLQSQVDQLREVCQVQVQPALFDVGCIRAMWLAEHVVIVHAILVLSHCNGVCRTFWMSCIVCLAEVLMSKTLDLKAAQWLCSSTCQPERTIGIWADCSC